MSDKFQIKSELTSGNDLKVFMNSKLFYPNEANHTDIRPDIKMAFNFKITERHTFKFKLSKEKQVMGSDFGLNVVSQDDSTSGYLAFHSAIKMTSIPDQQTRALHLYNLANFRHWLILSVLSQEQIQLAQP